MRREPYGIGSFVHIIHRGTRGAHIVCDNEDRDRFLLTLAHFNDEYQPENWFRDIGDPNLSQFERPTMWPEQKKLVRIIAFCLLDNHFHLLLEEIQEGGISKFMQRLGTSMSYRYNQKYEEKGSIFQGSFRSRTIDSDNHLRNVIAYVQLKNALDVYGKEVCSAEDFKRAYAWARAYPYASLGDHTGAFVRPIVETEFVNGIFSPEEFKQFGRDFIEHRIEMLDEGAVQFE